MLGKASKPEESQKSTKATVLLLNFSFHVSWG
jgi:hypothetical protein